MRIRAETCSLPNREIWSKCHVLYEIYVYRESENGLSAFWAILYGPDLVVALGVHD